jgi:hypothetical protein
MGSSFRTFSTRGWFLCKFNTQYFSCWVFHFNDTTVVFIISFSYKVFVNSVIIINNHCTCNLCGIGHLHCWLGQIKKTIVDRPLTQRMICHQEKTTKCYLKNQIYFTLTSQYDIMRNKKTPPSLPDFLRENDDQTIFFLFGLIVSIEDLQ